MSPTSEMPAVEGESGSVRMRRAGRIDDAEAEGRRGRRLTEDTGPEHSGRDR